MLVHRLHTSEGRGGAPGKAAQENGGFIATGKLLLRVGA